MQRWWVVSAVIVLGLASCATERGENRADAEADMPVLDALAPLADDWSRWLLGRWEITAESDLAQFKGWVKGRGQMDAEMVLGGQFLVITKAGQMTELSDEYVQYLKKTLHASDEDIQKLRNLHFGDLELRTIDPKTGQIVIYLFDSWRCVATGTGKLEGNRETMEWRWSVAGEGTSVRVTEKVSDDEFTVTEKYTLADGSIMQDRVQMIRKESRPDKEPRAPGRLPGEI